MRTLERKLMDYLPYVVREYQEFQAMLTGEQPEFARAWQDVDTLLDDQFVHTAGDAGLGRWETMLGFLPKASEGLEDRRLRILGRLNEELPYTLTRLREILQALCGKDRFDVNVEDYTLRVELDHVIHGKLADVRAVLERVCPENLFLWLYTHLVLAIPNPQDRFLLSRLAVSYRFRSYGGNYILLDGRRRLDGSWMLGQAASGARMIRTAYRARLSEGNAFDTIGWRCVSKIRTAQRDTLPSLSILVSRPWETGEALSCPVLQVKGGWQERRGLQTKIVWRGSKAKNTQRLDQTRTGFRAAWKGDGAVTVPRVHLKAAVRTTETLCGTLTRDQTWHFDGAYRFDGTKKFNAGSKEEL